VGTIKRFTDLKAWQSGQKLVVLIYELTKKFPSDEVFGLTNQIRRASISITSNIAEGFGRDSNPEKLHFYVMARGSANEVQSQLYAAKEIGYANGEEYEKCLQNADEAQRIIHGLIKATKDRIK